MRKSQTIALIALIIMSIAGSAIAEAAPAAQPSGVVNINTADVAQLSFLPRIGAKAAQRIERHQHPEFPVQRVERSIGLGAQRRRVSAAG